MHESLLERIGPPTCLLRRELLIASACVSNGKMAVLCRLPRLCLYSVLSVPLFYFFFLFFSFSGFSPFLCKFVWMSTGWLAACGIGLRLIGVEICVDGANKVPFLTHVSFVRRFASLWRQLGVKYYEKDIF